MTLPAQPNKSLIDGLECLQALASSRNPVGGRELARTTGMEPTRVNRILKTLAHLGLARQNNDRKYLPGPAMHVLAAQSLFGSGLIRKAMPALEMLHSETGLIVALGVLWRDKACYLVHATPDRPVSEGIGRSSLHPATRSAIGMAMLARADEQKVREIFQGQEIPGYQNDMKNLISDLKKTRKRGYARVEIRKKPRITSLGVVIGPQSEAALAVSGEIPEKKISYTVELLKSAAENIKTNS